jgi:hypothetical protein
MYIYHWQKPDEPGTVSSTKYLLSFSHFTPTIEDLSDHMNDQRDIFGLTYSALEKRTK